MKHFTVSFFWRSYGNLSKSIQKLADKNFELLKHNPQHSSLNLKQIRKYWSVRIGLKHRALAIEVNDGLLWFWIGSHPDYDKLIKN